MIQMLSTVMQLFKGSYFSVAAGSRHLWPNSVIIEQHNVKYKNYIFQRFTNETLIIGI